ncbi:MAG: RluA family pseudouridine synthase [Candidatus Saccharibacteria bacterium]|nr:RluA family pseudouridine synthase [Candidatus Saccharibacteria bacterium]
MIITGKKFSKPEMSRVINGDVQLSDGPEKAPKFRLDHLIMKLHPEWNRASLQSFIRNGYVTVNGEVITKPNKLLEEPVEIQLNLPEDLANPEVKAEKIKQAAPNTIFEDENVLVVDKPAGLLSMAKGEVCAEPTLEDYGLLVHRLDRDTSGIVILAKNEETQTLLRKQFQDRKAHKTYYAIIEGRPKLDSAKIDLPILRSIKRPNTFLVDPAGKPSVTVYKVTHILETTPEIRKKYDTDAKVLSLVELKPQTGRTHQLRVHLKYLGTPILGDRVYGPNENPKTRLFLHASSLEITIPESDRRTFETPLPAEFKEFIEVSNAL